MQVATRDGFNLKQSVCSCYALEVATRMVACITRDGSIAWSGVAMEASDEPRMVPMQGE